MKKPGRPRKPSSKKLVLSARGQRDIRLVALARLGAAAFTIVALVAVANRIGSWFDSGGDVTGVSFVLPIVAAFLAGTCAFAEIAYGGAAARAEETRVRHKLLKQVFEAPSSPHDSGGDTGPADLITLMTDNAERLTEYRQVYFGATLAAISIPFVTLAYVAVAFNWVVGVTLMFLAVMVPILIRMFMMFFRKTSARSRKERAILSGKYLDAIRNLVLIRLLCAGPRVEANLREQGEKNRGAIMRLLAGNQVVIIIMDGLFSLLLICAAAALSIWQYSAGNLTLTHAVAIMLLTTLLVEPLVQVAGFFYIGMGGMASERKIAKYLREQAEIKSAIASRAQHLGEGEGEGVTTLADHGTKHGAGMGMGEGDAHRAAAAPVQVGEPRGSAINLSDVTFDYGRGPVLRGVDLDVPYGSKTAIIGRSGAGKSTLLSLLRGTLPLQGGAASVDRRDLRTLDPAQLRELTASVSQKTWLFTGTIADNLRLAAPDATEEDMWSALEAAQVAEEVSRMPGALETEVGEAGQLISGGQAQRISLARALLSGRRILLLDEPTSQIDVESEERLIAALDALGPEWTILMVTHRPSLLRIADAAWSMTAGTLRPADVGAAASRSTRDERLARDAHLVAAARPTGDAQAPREARAPRDARPALAPIGGTK